MGASRRADINMRLVGGAQRRVKRAVRRDMRTTRVVFWPVLEANDFSERVSAVDCGSECLNSEGMRIDHVWRQVAQLVVEGLAA